MNKINASKYMDKNHKINPHPSPTMSKQNMLFFRLFYDGKLGGVETE